MSTKVRYSGRRYHIAYLPLYPPSAPSGQRLVKPSSMPYQTRWWHGRCSCWPPPTQYNCTLRYCTVLYQLLYNMDMCVATARRASTPLFCKVGVVSFTGTTIPKHQISEANERPPGRLSAMRNKLHYLLFISPMWKGDWVLDIHSCYVTPPVGYYL